MTVSKGKLREEGRGYKIWKIVEEIVLDKYSQLAGEMMRDTYYLLREWLEPLRDKGKITDTEFDYFVDNYEYYRDDFWPRMEKKHNIRRPETKPPTVVIDRGEEYTEAHLSDAWDRARGFIFVEKSGMASHLKLLSYHGWLIVAAQGESTRTFREFAAQDVTNRPILAITDADWYGGGIVETLKGYSERTEHLGLWRDLEDRIKEIGLIPEDADGLDLPKERDPTKSPNEWRTELNALVVLKNRHGIDIPLLSYVIAKMREMDVPICPLPYDDPERHVKHSIKSHLIDELEDFLEEIIDDVSENIDDFEEDLPHGREGAGDHVQLLLDSSVTSLELRGIDPLEEALKEIAEEDLERLFWRRRTAYEKKIVLEKVGREGIEKIRAMIGRS